MKICSVALEIQGMFYTEANKISIGPKAVRLHWPLLPDCWRSVELEEIPIEICTVGALTALQDHLYIRNVFFYQIVYHKNNTVQLF